MAAEDVDLIIHCAIIQIPQINENKRLAYEVNILGTHNVCRVVDENPRIMGLILSSTWHTIGERELRGTVNEDFGFRPDKVEGRARLYALSKIAQEAIVRFYNEMSEKVFGIIRIGTVLGEGMPAKTAANIFIENGLSGKPLTPFRHSMYRPMLYVGVGDVCRAYEVFARKILNQELRKDWNSSSYIFNVYYPEPVTIIELAEIVRDTIIKYSEGRIKPAIQVVDTGEQVMFSEKDKELIRIDLSKAIDFFGIKRLKSPRESIEEIIKSRMR